MFFWTSLGRKFSVDLMCLLLQPPVSLPLSTALKFALWIRHWEILPLLVVACWWEWRRRLCRLPELFRLLDLRVHSFLLDTNVTQYSTSSGVSRQLAASLFSAAIKWRLSMSARMACNAVFEPVYTTACRPVQAPTAKSVWIPTSSACKIEAPSESPTEIVSSPPLCLLTRNRPKKRPVGGTALIYVAHAM